MVSSVMKPAKDSNSGHCEITSESLQFFTVMVDYQQSGLTVTASRVSVTSFVHTPAACSFFPREHVCRVYCSMFFFYAAHID